MMKKPLNRAISPRPPYGVLAPTWGTSCRPIPKTDRPGDEQEREQELRVRVRDLPDPARAALARQRGLEHDHDHQRDDGDADAERDGLLEGDEEQLHRGRDASRRPGGQKPLAAPAVRWPEGRLAVIHPNPWTEPPPVNPFDRLGRFVVRRARLVVAAWGVLIVVALPLAPQVPGRAERGWLHPRRPRIGARQGAPRGRSSGRRHRRW